MESQEHIFMINGSVGAINAAEDKNYGEILKSGDNTLLKYKIFDGDGEPLQLEGLPCEAVIKKDDIVVYRTPAEVDAENIVNFKITEVLPSDRNDPYTIEFIITQDQDILIFPSDDRINLYIYPSSLSADGDIINQTPEERLNEIVIVAVNDATQDFYSEVDNFRDTYNELIDTGVIQENINQKLAESEAEYAPRLTELEQNDADLTAQLAQTDGRVDNLVLEYDIDPNKDPEIIDARKSVNTGITYDLLGQRINELEAVQMLGGELIPTDYSDTPGGKVILKGNREYGFLGFVQPEEMGKLLDNPEDNQEFNGVNLAAAVGITQGTAINSNTPWMKFFSGNDIIFVPVKPIRHSTTWNSIYNAGAVYGDGTIGVNPPNGRAGNKLSVDGSNSSFLIETDGADRGFLMSGAVIASVGDTIVTRGFANEENNGEFVISEITDTAIKVNATLFTEPKGRNSASIYKEGDEVRQDAEVTVGKNKYKVRLLKGAAQDPLDSYSDSDRNLVGPASEWNNLILPLHERAKLGDWNYRSHAGDVDDWGVGLTDKDLVTHHTLGHGSYSWMQESSDIASFHRVIRGYFGASYGTHNLSWTVDAGRGWRPALHLSS